MTNPNPLPCSFPEHPTIMGREKYFNCAVFAPFIVVKNEYHLLFQKRAPAIRQGGEICFPGGKIDPAKDNDAAATATRETTEELCLTKQQIKIDGQLDTIIAPMGAAIDIFVGRILDTQPKNIAYNQEEVEEIFTIPFAHFQNNPPQKHWIRLEVQPYHKDKNGIQKTLLPANDLNLPERYTRPWGGHLYPIYAYKTNHGTIWGITAEIIREIVSRNQ